MNNLFGQKISVRRKSQMKAVLFAGVVILLIGSLLLVFIFTMWGSSKSGHSWPYGDCSKKCSKPGFETKPLLVISLDGFKRSYIDRGLVKTLERMSTCGTTAEYMYSTYPSKTFPNHYAIATGLYPESSGIVDNAVYDERFATKLVDVRLANDERYFGGEPIWNVLERQNMTTACLFWAGSELPINGMRPTYYLKYNRSMSYRDRVEQILTWLSMPANKRPALIMAYFDQPDTVGHYQKSEEEVDEQLKNIDSVLNYLFETLYQMALVNCVNIIILSDHGMQKLDHRYYLDEMIDLEQDDALFTNGVIGRIHFPHDYNASLQNKILKIMERLHCPDVSNYRIYDRRRLPKRYHFSATRKVGDIILDGQPGTIFFNTRAADYHITHDHGYDFMLPSMRTIFYAHGPNIARRMVLKPFQNIELFNLMIALLNVSSNVPPNNGTEGRLNSVLKGIPVKKPHRAVPLEECSIANFTEDEKSCHLGASSLISGHEELCYLSNCLDSYLKFALIISSKSNRTIALIERINSEISVPKLRRKKQSAALTESNLGVKDTNYLEVKLYNDFVKGRFADLQSLTLRYAEVYNEIIVVSGPIYDFDDNGLTDSEVTSSQQSGTLPSHIFRIIFRCAGNSKWLSNKFQCEQPSSLLALPFILPNIPHDNNCLDLSNYLTANMARLRDIELLTGLEFLPASPTPEKELYDDEFSVTLRTMIPEQLWADEELKS